MNSINKLLKNENKNGLLEINKVDNDVFEKFTKTIFEERNEMVLKKDLYMVREMELW